MTPSDQQHRCIKSAADWFRYGAGEKQVLTFAGYAGTGKSTCLPFMIDEFGLHPDDVQFCAPTGKAAKVMSEKLRQQQMPAVAKTIHSSIYTPRAERAEILEAKLKSAENSLMHAVPGENISFDGEVITPTHLRQIIKTLHHDLDKAYVNTDGPKFTLNIASTIYERKLIVVDEGSMVGKEVAQDLLSFGIPVLVMGDPGQLPPVKDEVGFDLEDPDLFLTEIHRQAADNPIIQLATLARQGQLLKVGSYGDGRAQVIRRRDDNVTYDMDRDVQVIVGTHKYRWEVTSRIRKAAGYTSNAPEAGEPLLCCKNSKNIPSLINGSIVKAMEAPSTLINESPNFVLVYEDEEGNKRTSIVNQGLFEEHEKRMRGAFSCQKREAYLSRKVDEQFDWAWAITCHKAQGSAWSDVVVHDESGAFREDAAKWLYTAITRAADRLTVVV